MTATSIHDENEQYAGDLRPSWAIAFTDGFAPSMSDAALEAGRMALINDDPRLLQGATTSPPPMNCVEDWSVDAADFIGFCGWQGDGLRTVGEVENYFARLCHECDQRLNCPAACRYLLNWFDDMPRDAMRRELLAVVNEVIESRRLLAVA